MSGTRHRDPFATLTRRRPRLMATAATIARMKGVLHTHQTAARWRDEIAKQADQILILPPLTPDWVNDPAETARAPLPQSPKVDAADGAASPLDIARLFVLRIQTLGIMWFALGDSRYRDRAKQELLAVCAFPDWVGDEFLVTAETTFGAAIGYDWLFDDLTEAERQLVVAAILSKGLQPGLAQFAANPPAHWTVERMNWSLVCNGALMIAALSIAESDPTTTARIFRLCKASIRHGFSLYRPDGGWIEGPGYWHYATQYAVYLVDSLSTALGDDLRLGRSPGFGQTGIFRLQAAGPSGKLFNFADSDEHHSGGYWLFWLASRYHHPVDAWIERHRGKPHPMDLLWFDPSARSPATDNLSTRHRFRGAEVAMLRGGWKDLKNTYVGIKGGANNSCPHAHYDLGSFVLDAEGSRWAIDLGPDNYHLPGYFNPARRCLYYRTNTLGHNTLVINDQSQPPTASAPIIRADFGLGLATVVLDLSSAYPDCTSALRGFALISDRDVVIVDEIVPACPIAVAAWQMHTGAEIDARHGTAVLTLPGADNPDPAHLYLRIIGPPGLVFSIAAAAPPGPPGQNPNLGISKLLVRLDDLSRPLRLTVILSPDSDACSTPTLPPALTRPLSEWGRGVR